MKGKTPVKVCGVFYFDPEDRIFSDHFPGCPVVPGSLIVHAFFKAAAQKVAKGAEKSSQQAWQVKKFKFKRFVEPGEYAYSLHWEEPVADRSEKILPVECRLYDKQAQVAKGTLLF